MKDQKQTTMTAIATAFTAPELTFTSKVTVRPTKRDIYAEEVEAIEADHRDKANKSKVTAEGKRLLTVMLSEKPSPKPCELYVKFDFEGCEKEQLEKVLKNASSLTVSCQSQLRALGASALPTVCEKHKSASEPYIYSVKVAAEASRSQSDPKVKAEKALGKLSLSEQDELLKKQLEARGVDPSSLGL